MACCANNHPLTLTTRTVDWKCDVCARPFTLKQQTWMCAACDFDACADCCRIKCKNRHAIGAPKPRDVAFNCDVCATLSPAGALACTCRACDYDVCAKCTERAPSAVAEPRNANTHVTLDKPLYKPGETLRCRALVLDSVSHRPLTLTPASSELAGFTMRLIGPKGDASQETRLEIRRESSSIPWSVNCEFVVPDTGGDYQIEAAPMNWDGTAFAPAGRRAFEVRAYRPPRLVTDLDFARKAYGPGDRVIASLNVKRAEGGVPVGAEVTAVATLDGEEIHRSIVSLDAGGNCEVRFDLPYTVRGEGEGALTMSVRDGGVQESAVKTIPIPSNRLDVAFYPEAGDLVPGATRQRVYVAARTPKGKPADVAGEVYHEASGQRVASFRTVHEGRGRFELEQPVDGRAAYYATITEPAGIAARFPLPVRAPNLASPEPRMLKSLADVFGGSGPLRFEIGPHKDSHSLLLRVKSTIVAQADVAALGTPTVVEIVPSVACDGVLIATLVDRATQLPAAERLVFRQPPRAIRVEVTGPTRAALRERATIQVRTVDAATGVPVKATVLVAATDDSVCKKIEKRERAPRLAAQALLEDDVRELRDCDAYLAAPDEESRLRTDLLLATQGWRRFLFTDARHAPRDGDTAVAERVRAKLVVAPSRPPPPPPLPMEMFAMVPCCAPCLPGRAAMAMVPCAAVAPPNRPMMAAGPPPQAIAAAVALAPEPPAVGDVDLGVVARPVAGDAKLVAAPKLRLAAEGRVVAQKPPATLHGAFLSVTREYAHAAPSNKGAPDRTDFAETLFWNPSITTEDEDGTATVAFDLCDSITSFEVRVDAVSASGMLGEGVLLIEARKPFYVEPKLPLEVSAGDRPLVPISLCNATNQRLTAQVRVEAQAPLAVLDAAATLPPVALDADGRGRVLCAVAAHERAGTGTFTVRAEAGTFNDCVTRSVVVAEPGFPRHESFAGTIEANSQRRGTFKLPNACSGLAVRATVFTSPAANLEKAVVALLAEPCGCFEQTSSSAYPNVMVLKYLAKHSGVNPEIVKRAKDLLERGLKRLLSYECKQKGYEWFGGDPGHEALTAYGLMEFTEMAQVGGDVDAAMLQRTRDWLLSRRAKDGSFERNGKALDSFGRAPPDTTNAYITWALARCNTPGIQPQLDYVYQAVTSGSSKSDSYVVALAANALFAAGDAKRGAQVTASLAGLFDSSGGKAPPSRVPSITGSTGANLEIETTSLGILAFSQDAQFLRSMHAAYQWLSGQCKGGRFGATQGTILALQAIIAVDELAAKERVGGTLSLSVSSATASAPLDLSGSTALALSNADVTRLAAMGESDHTVELALQGGFPVPFVVDVDYYTPQPASDDCSVQLSTALSATRVKEGECVDVNVTVRNLTDAGVAMTVAIVGLPGGLEPRTDQLRELVAERRIDAYETRGREVVLYWRGMAPRGEARVPLSVLAAVPGTYAGPASRAYLYYSDDKKHWVQPLRVTVDA